MCASDSTVSVTQALDLRFWFINWPDGNRPSLFLFNIILWLRLMRMAIATNVWRYLVSWYTQSCQRTIFMIHTDVDRWQIGHWFNLSYHFDVTQQIIIPVFGVILDFRIAPKSVNVITHSKKKTLKSSVLFLRSKNKLDEPNQIDLILGHWPDYWPIFELIDMQNIWNSNDWDRKQFGGIENLISVLWWLWFSCVSHNFYLVKVFLFWWNYFQ